MVSGRLFSVTAEMAFSLVVPLPLAQCSVPGCPDTDPFLPEPSFLVLFQHSVPLI